MRLTVPALAAVLALALAACGGSGSSATPTAQSTRTANSPTAAAATVAVTPQQTAASATPAPVETTPAGEITEVTGIVGTVSTATQTIEIKRLQGASVTRLEVGPRTVIRKAAGGTAQLRDVKPSDRIVAKGALNDRGDALVATEITVQDILPGAQPGG
jgi:hypothetical protein